MIELKTCACSIDEQETTIQISRDGKEIHLWTCDNTRITKMQKPLARSGSLSIRPTTKTESRLDTPSSARIRECLLSDLKR